MRWYKPVLTGALLMAFPGAVTFAQYDPQRQYPGPQEYQAPGAYQDQGYGLSGSQLENLVAPIALYPDALLSQVLVASTYPQQLAQARQWLAQTQYMPVQQRLEAAQQQDWDPSVQALVAFPDVLQRLTQDPQWTADLGNAFLNNESAVMDAVQDLRERARQSGRLRSTPQQMVNVENYNGERAIEIVPSNPDIVYVPTYDPVYIWGAPAYGYYPSLYYPSVGLGFGSGISIGAFFGGYRGGFGGWGWAPRWHSRTVIVNNDFLYRNRFNGYRDGRYSTGSEVWRHDDHRGNAFSTGYAGRQQNSGLSNYNQQTVQPSYNNTYRQQGFRSNQPVNPQYQAPADRYRRQFSNQMPQARGFQQTPQQQFSQPRSFQEQAPHQQFSQPRSFQEQASHQQFSQPRSFQQQAPQQQFSQPRSFRQQAPQQQFSQPRSFQQQAPRQQFSRPQYSQPQARQSEHGFSRHDESRGRNH